MYVNDPSEYMPYSLIYDDTRGTIAHYGYYLSHEEANKAVIEAVKKNNTLSIGYFHIVKRDDEQRKPARENWATAVLPEITVTYNNTKFSDGGVSFGESCFIGSFHSDEEANNAIINDMETVHKDATIENYSVDHRQYALL